MEKIINRIIMSLGVALGIKGWITIIIVLLIAFAIVLFMKTKRK